MSDERQFTLGLGTDGHWFASAAPSSGAGGPIGRPRVSPPGWERVSLGPGALFLTHAGDELTVTSARFGVASVVAPQPVSRDDSADGGGMGRQGVRSEGPLATVPLEGRLRRGGIHVGHLALRLADQFRVESSGTPKAGKVFGCRSAHGPGAFHDTRHGRQHILMKSQRRRSLLEACHVRQGRFVGKVANGPGHSHRPGRPRINKP
jgi:hypothetical protein